MEHFSSFLLVFQLLNHLDSLSNILQKRKKENNRNHVNYHINLIFATICSIKEERSRGTVDQPFISCPLNVIQQVRLGEFSLHT